MEMARIQEQKLQNECMNLERQLTTVKLQLEEVNNQTLEVFEIIVIIGLFRCSRNA